MDERAAESGDVMPPLSWQTRVAMLAGGLFVAIAMSALTPVLPKIQDALAVDDQQRLLVKMLVPIMGVTMVIGAPLTGWLADRMGFRKILIAHGMLYAIGGTAGLYLSDLNLLLASRLIVGLGAAGLATISMTLISTHLRGIARARWMGFHISTAMFGGMIILPTIGLLGELGWRWPFAAYASSLIIVAVALTGIQEPDRQGGRDAAEAAPRAAAANPLKWFPLWFLLLALVMGSVTYLPNVYLAFVMQGVGVSSPTAVSLVMLADVVIGACMSLLFGRGQRHMSSEAAFVVSFGCTGVGMSIVAMAASPAAVIAGMLVFGFGIGWFVPNLMNAVSVRVLQHQQGTAVGIVKAAHYLASPLAVLAVEPIARVAGPGGAMMSGAALSFATVAVFSLLIVGRRRSAPHVGNIASIAPQ